MLICGCKSGLALILLCSWPGSMSSLKNTYMMKLSLTQWTFGFEQLKRTSIGIYAREGFGDNVDTGREDKGICQNVCNK